MRKDIINKMTKLYGRNIKDFNAEGYYFLPENLSFLEKYLGEEDMKKYYSFKKYSDKFKYKKEVKLASSKLVTRKDIRELIQVEKDQIFKSYLYYLTQDELISHIKSVLKQKGIEYKQDDYGNIWGINHNDKPIFVSHLDTVNDSDEEFRVELRLTVDAEGRSIVYRPGYVLGADDRAGVNAMLNNIEDINFVFCLDEESGRLGSKDLSKVAEFIDDCKKGTFFCQIDRKDTTHIIGYTHGYCNKDLEDEVIKKLPGIQSMKGSFTDIDSFVDISQGFNISAGYFNAHSAKEYLDYEYFIELSTHIVPTINSIEGFREKKTKTYTYGSYERKSYGGYGGYYGSSWSSCSVCGDKYCDTIWFNGKWVCKDCKEKTVSFTLATTKKGKCNICGQDLQNGEVVKKIKLGDKDVVVCLDCLTTEVYNNGK